MSRTDVKEAVRERYSQAAQRVSEGRSSTLEPLRKSGGCTQSHKPSRKPKIDVGTRKANSGR